MNSLGAALYGKPGSGARACSAAASGRHRPLPDSRPAGRRPGWPSTCEARLGTRTPSTACRRLDRLHGLHRLAPHLSSQRHLLRLRFRPPGERAAAALQESHPGIPTSRRQGLERPAASTRHLILSSPAPLDSQYCRPAGLELSMLRKRWNVLRNSTSSRPLRRRPVHDGLDRAATGDPCVNRPGGPRHGTARSPRRVGATNQ